MLSKKDKGLDDKDVKLEEGSKPEVYTEEHAKLLGKTERSWTFFVDGYGEDGRRIYDPVKGKTCHQCRSDIVNSICACVQLGTLGFHLLPSDFKMGCLIERKTI